MIKIGRLYREKLVELLSMRKKATDAVFFVNFRGLTAIQLTTLRSNLKDKQARMLVAKNPLIKRSFAGKAEGIDNLLTAETAVVYSGSDLVETAKVLFDFTKDNEKFQVKGGYVNDALLDTKQLETISKLPSRKVLYGMVVNCVASPLAGLVSSLNQIVSKVVWAIDAIKKQKEQKEG
jgi:large subunit ribosomal protein L10